MKMKRAITLCVDSLLLAGIISVLTNPDIIANEKEYYETMHVTDHQINYSTENADKEEARRLELQERMTDRINLMDGIDSSVVIINIGGEPSAFVEITPCLYEEITAGHQQAIKKLLTGGINGLSKNSIILEIKKR